MRNGAAAEKTAADQPIYLFNPSGDGCRWYTADEKPDGAWQAGPRIEVLANLLLEFNAARLLESPGGELVRTPLIAALAAEGGVIAQAPSTQKLAPLSDRMLKAMRRLTKEREPHPCGGFTTDDMQWQMGTAFLNEDDLHEALEELLRHQLIRYAGHDDDDAIGTCHELTETGKATEGGAS